jgi:hypothetical protein
LIERFLWGSKRKGIIVTKSEIPDKGCWDEIYKQEEYIITREIVGETILVPIRGKLADMQRIFTLNEVGAYIWSSLDGEKSLGHICEGLQSEFDVGSDQAKRDMVDFVSELLEADLIVGIL